MTDEDLWVEVRNAEAAWDAAIATNRQAVSDLPNRLADGDLAAETALKNLVSARQNYLAVWRIWDERFGTSRPQSDVR